MKKKILISTALIALMCVSCRGGSDTSNESSKSSGSSNSTGSTVQEKVTISYWNLLTGADGTTMRQLVKDFNEEYKGVVEVAEQSVNEIDYYNTLNMTIPINRGPDVAIMHSYYVQSYANRELIVPIDTLVERSEINLDDYLPDVVNSLYFEDELYGIPLDIHPVGIYYNKDLLEQYGCSIPTNRSELIACAQKAPNTDGSVWGLPISAEWPTEYTFTTSLYQHNGKELNGTDQPGYETSEAQKAFTAMTDFIHKYNVSPKNLGNDQDLFYFKNNKAFFHFQGSWMLNSIIDSGVNFGIIPLSKMFNESSSTIGVRSHTFVFPYKKTVDANKQSAAMTFVKYLTDHSYKWATAGQIPASVVARNTDAYKALPYHDGFGKVEDFRVATSSPFYSEAFSPIYSRLTYAMRNNDGDVAKMLSEAAVEGRKLIAEAKENLG